MQSFSLKPWDDGDAAEGKSIVEAMAKEEEANNTGTSKKAEGNKKA